MFNSIKAISLGIIILLSLELINQLILIMSAVGFNFLIKSYPSLIPWSQIFTYSMGAFGHFIVMSLTGMTVAITSVSNRACLNAGIAATIGSSISLYLSLRDDIFTPIAFIFLISGIIFALIACSLWLKHAAKKS